MKWFKDKPVQPTDETTPRQPRAANDMRSQLGIQSDSAPAVRARVNRSQPAGETASSVYDEQMRLNDLKIRTRRRLIGAGVLLTAAFVILPWVFDEQNKQTAAQVAVSVPDKNLQFEVKNPQTATSATPANSNNTAPAVTQTNLQPVQASAPVAEKPESKVEVKPPEPKPVAKPEPTPTPTPTPSPSKQKYAVHIGLVTSGTELDALLTKLRAAGVEPQLKTVTVDGVNKTRVRLGLFDSQAEAEAAAKKARGAAKNPVVIPIKTEQP